MQANPTHIKIPADLPINLRLNVESSTVCANIISVNIYMAYLRTKMYLQGFGLQDMSNWSSYKSSCRFTIFGNVPKSEIMYKVYSFQLGRRMCKLLTN